MGPGQAFLHILCFSSCLKYLDNSIFDAKFLSCFEDTKSPYQMEELLDGQEHRAPASWTDKANPCDTPLLLHQPVRELCTS